MIVKLLNEHNLEFLSLKGGCTGSSSESTLEKNTTLFEISCRGIILLELKRDGSLKHPKHYAKIYE